MMKEIRVALDEGAIAPTRKHPTDAGMDLYWYNPGCVELSLFKAGIHILHTGTYIDIPEGYFGLIKPKSRSNYDVLAGVVDYEYTGEILVKIWVPEGGVTLFPGSAIAQILFIPIITPAIVIVDSSRIGRVTPRGESGGIVNELSYKG